MAETPPYYCPTCGIPDGHTYGCTANRYATAGQLTQIQAALTAAEQRDELAAALRGVLRESDRKTDSEWPLAKRVQALVQRCRTFEDVLTMMPEFGNMTNYGPACVACGEHQRETWGYVARGPDRGHKQAPASSPPTGPARRSGTNSGSPSLMPRGC